MATKSYHSLQQEIAKLQEQAEAIRAEEVASVVAKIKEAIDSYGLSPSDLFGRSVQSGAKASRRKVGNTVAYSDGQGGEWGGRGPRPLWLRDALAAGHSLEEFAVGGATAAKKSAAGSSKKSGRTSYKNPDGYQTWSGFGRKPAWLVEALDAGHTLESMTA